MSNLWSGPRAVGGRRCRTPSPPEALEERALLAAAVHPFPLPMPVPQSIGGITPGPGGDLWFTESGGSARIGRISPAGEISQVPLAIDPGTNLGAITSGPDGNLWFIESTTEGGPSQRIGRLTPAGDYAEFALTGTTWAGSALSIAPGPDGNIWFTTAIAGATPNTTAQTYGRITPAGVATLFPPPEPGAQVGGLAPGPDGNLWAIAHPFPGAEILRITPEGGVTKFPLPIGVTVDVECGLAAGPDGNLWFAARSGPIEAAVGLVARITTAGAIATFPLPADAGSAGPLGPRPITSGPDGTLWLSLPSIGRLVRVSTSGETSTIATGLGPEYPVGLVPGPDGNVWFRSNTSVAGTIGRASPGGAVATFDVPPILTTDPSIGEGIHPRAITRGPDGNLWFVTHAFANDETSRISRISPGGDLATFSLPTGGGLDVQDLAAGPDGNLWFTGVVGRYSEDQKEKVGRITPSGAIRLYELTESGPAIDDAIGGITAGPDGNLWFTRGTAIGRITPGGVVTEFPIPHPADGVMSFGGTLYVRNIASGADGNLWYTANTADDQGRSRGLVGRITPAGIVTEYRLRQPRMPRDDKFRPMFQADAIATGPDGNVWFTAHRGTEAVVIGRITPKGSIRQFRVGKGRIPDVALAIATGPDGALWFTQASNNFDTGPNPQPRLGRITPSGRVSYVTLPDPVGGANSLTTGPDGRLWFTDAVSQVVRLLSRGSRSRPATR